MNKKTAVQSLARFLTMVILIVFTGCRPAEKTYSASSQFTAGPTIAEFTESGVRVVVALETDEERRTLLRATFTPLDPGFHLYGKDLPEKGVQGIGRPTRLDIPEQAAIRSAGPAFASVTAQDHPFDVLGVTLPIYPEGPVVIRIPVEMTPAEGGIAAQLAFTYMACQTSGKCLMPVQRKLVEAKIPKQ